jgi:hypothetical protein
MGPLRLKTGSRIGIKVAAFVEPEAIESAGTRRAYQTGKITIPFGLQVNLRAFLLAFQDHARALPPGPDPEMGPARRLYLRPNG